MSLHDVNTLTCTLNIHRTLDIDYLSTRHKQHVATEMFKVQQGLVPGTVLSHFQNIGQTHTRKTCLSCSNNFKVPNFKLEMCRRSFMYREPKVWMQVPLELKLVPSSESFRHGIQSLWRFYGDPGIT